MWLVDSFWSNYDRFFSSASSLLFWFKYTCRLIFFILTTLTIHYSLTLVIQAETVYEYPSHYSYSLLTPSGLPRYLLHRTGHNCHANPFVFTSPCCAWMQDIPWAFPPRTYSPGNFPHPDNSPPFLSASLYFSKRGAYWDRLCPDVVGRWLVVTRVHCGETVHPRPIVTMEH